MWMLVREGNYCHFQFSFPGKLHIRKRLKAAQSWGNIKKQKVFLACEVNWKVRLSSVPTSWVMCVDNGHFPILGGHWVTWCWCGSSCGWDSRHRASEDDAIESFFGFWNDEFCFHLTWKHEWQRASCEDQFYIADTLFSDDRWGTRQLFHCMLRRRCSTGLAAIDGQANATIWRWVNTAGITMRRRHLSLCSRWNWPFPLISKPETITQSKTKIMTCALHYSNLKSSSEGWKKRRFADGADGTERQSSLHLAWLMEA